VFDLPDVVEGAHTKLRDAGLTDRGRTPYAPG
jgi:hypothetical protein